MQKYMLENIIQYRVWEVKIYDLTQTKTKTWET